MILQFVVAVLLVYSSSTTAVDVSDDAGRILPQLSFYHRFSAQLKERAQRDGKNWVFPALNTPEYHKYLAGRDFARHGRRLAASPRALTFSEGNYTILSPDGIHYSVVDIGTPAVSHFVALDTGSDFFWLPCECIACAPVYVPYFTDAPLDVYVPLNSTTSKSISCSSSDCSSSFSTCKGPTSDQCSYNVAYSPPDTSTSGIVFQDVLHLTANRGAVMNVTTPIILGCAQTQTGQLASGRTQPDGTMGLGPQSYSVPSMLAQSGLVGNSFSLCFKNDGSGRIVFGDFGSNPKTTPFQDNPQAIGYFIGLTSISVGSDSIPVNEPSVFDAGTSLTYLTTSVYKAVIDSFASQANYTQFPFDAPFDLCYKSTAKPAHVPTIVFELNGATSVPIHSSLVYYLYPNGSRAGFCLGLEDGGTTNIFGVNFMGGYNLVFNLQDSTLGFEKKNCYHTVSSSASHHSPGVSPILAPSPTPTSTTGIIGSTTPSPETTPPAPSPGSVPSPGLASRTRVSLLFSFSLGLLVHCLLL